MYLMLRRPVAELRGDERRGALADGELADVGHRPVRDRRLRRRARQRSASLLRKRWARPLLVLSLIAVILQFGGWLLATDAIAVIGRRCS